jgi:hypothetical protein
MADDSIDKTDQPRTQAAPAKSSGLTDSGNPNRSTSSNLTGDPVRREFGDRRNEASKTADPSKAGDKRGIENQPRSGARTDTDADEDQKDPRANPVKASSDNSSRTDRSNSSNPSNQQTQQQKPSQPIQLGQKTGQKEVGGKTGSDSSSSSKQADGKTAGTKGDS